MKKAIITKYIQGLASFLDEKNITWKRNEKGDIVIYYHDLEDLFRIGFDFGKFYSTTD